MRQSAARQQDELLKGTLDMLILKTLAVRSLHGYAIVQHIERLSNGVFAVEQGTLYPALQRLQKKGWLIAKWGVSPTGRKARYYSITAAGRKRLGEQVSSFERVLAAIQAVMSGR
jgi:PadR family transcriptional regulator, regulatory protein PadR